MCGIVGIIAKNSSGFFKKHQTIFEELLYVDNLRGEDSTGIIAALKDNTFYTLRDGLASYYTLQAWKDHQINKEVFSTGQALIGHNRKATVGKVSEHTAHPFVVKDEFAMVHNGTLLNHKKLADTEVDSEALAMHLHAALAEEDVSHLETALGEVTGAYAIAAYDQRSQKIHLLRNKERPLWLAELSNSWVFASEYGMLWWILHRKEASDAELKSIRPVTEHVLFTFSKTNHIMTLKETALTIKKATPQPVVLAPAGVAGVAGTTSKTPFKVTTNPISKNSFKRFRKANIFTEIEFWIDDWVEKHFPKTIEDGERDVLLLGEFEDASLNCKVNVVAEYTLTTPSILDSLEDSLWKGRISEISLDRKTNSIQLHITNCTSRDGLVKGNVNEETPQSTLH